MDVVRWLIIKNYIENFSFENENLAIPGLARGWELIESPIVALKNKYVKEGYYTQYINASNTGNGIKQLINIVNRNINNFKLIYYAKVQGSWKVIINGYDENKNLISNILTKEIGSNNNLIKYIETFEINNNNISYIDIQFVSNSNDNNEMYLDCVLLFENNQNVEVELNPTTFNYNIEEYCDYQETITGEIVKILPIDYSKRKNLKTLNPIWMYVTKSQKDFYESLVGSDVVIITHEDEIFWVDIKRITINYKIETVPQIYEINMELEGCKR